MVITHFYLKTQTPSISSFCRLAAILLTILAAQRYTHTAPDPLWVKGEGIPVFHGNGILHTTTAAPPRDVGRPNGHCFGLNFWRKRNG